MLAVQAAPRSTLMLLVDEGEGPADRERMWQASALLWAAARGTEGHRQTSPISMQGKLSGRCDWGTGERPFSPGGNVCIRDGVMSGMQGRVLLITLAAGAPSNPVAYGAWMLDNVVAASVSALRGRVASYLASTPVHCVPLCPRRCSSRRPSERLGRRNPFRSSATPNRPAGSQRLCSLVHRHHGRHVRATPAAKCA